MRTYTIQGKRNVCGDRVRQARQLQRFSQSDICLKLQLAGIPMERDSLSRIESGNRFVTDYEIMALAEVLGVSIYWLLGKE